MDNDPITYSVGSATDDVEQEDWVAGYDPEDYHPSPAAFNVDKVETPQKNDDLLYAQSLLGAGAAVMERKRRGYSPGDNLFSAFDLAGHIVNVAIDMGIRGNHLVFIIDIAHKLKRAMSLISTGEEVEEEPVYDTCMDAGNYFALWAAFIRKERQER